MLRSKSILAHACPGVRHRTSRVLVRLGTVVLLALGVFGVAGCGRNQPLSPELASVASPLRSQSVAFLDPAPGQPLHVTGKIGPGALYVIDKPANWNGGLVVWAHGYTVPSDPVAPPNLGALLQFFLSQGFAVAASSYSENGYAVAEAVRQTHQLNGLFAELVAEPDRTYLVGASLGGIINLKLLEKYDRQYDGALLVSGVVGGSDDEVRYLGDVWVLFDKFFPGVLPPLFGERPGPFPQAQIIGIVTDPANGQAFQLFLAFARERGLPFTNGQQAVTATLTALGFTWIGGLDFLDRTHGHELYDNEGTTYTAGGVPQPVVDDVNATVDRLTSTPDAKRFLRSHYEPDGDLAIPVITLHDQLDPLVPIFHERLLHDRVASAGKLSLLRQYDTASFGHVSSTVQGQIPGKFLELVGWVNSLAATP